MIQRRLPAVYMRGGTCKVGRAGSIWAPFRRLMEGWVCVPTIL